MTLLTKDQLKSLKIVELDKPLGWRETTYDSTVGKIINHSGKEVGQHFVLKPRAIVWVVSNERFNLPRNVTGITTLKTGWTNEGILTLTVGIVDPGYHGHLSTAVINFSKQDFPIEINTPFFRTAFFQHNNTKAASTGQPTDDYHRMVRKHSAAFSETFLTIDTLAGELSPKLFGLPQLAIKIGFGALAAALLALTIPPAFGLWTELLSDKIKLESLEKRIEKLERIETKPIDHDQVNLITPPNSLPSPPASTLLPRP